MPRTLGLVVCRGEPRSILRTRARLGKEEARDGPLSPIVDLPLTRLASRKRLGPRRHQLATVVAMRQRSPASIPDRKAPYITFLQKWPELSALLIDRLAAGQNIFIHCMGGLGRTGVVAAMLLIEAEIPVDKAIKLVRQSRPHTIETSEQEAFVRNHVRSHSQN